MKQRPGANHRAVGHPAMAVAKVLGVADVADLVHFAEVDVRHEVVSPIDLTALDQRERRVIAGRLNVLEARDLRHPLAPVVRVLVEHVVLRREARDARERA